MGEREMLELAAKAFGFGVHPKRGHEVCWTESEYPKGSGKNGALWNYVGHMDTAELWNPLTDDGDALRLAVKLNLKVVCHPALNQAIVRLYHATEDEWVENYEDHPDPTAAIRRAITVAAAEIGKAIAPGAEK